MKSILSIQKIDFKYSSKNTIQHKDDSNDKATSTHHLTSIMENTFDFLWLINEPLFSFYRRDNDRSIQLQNLKRENDLMCHYKKRQVEYILIALLGKFILSCTSTLHGCLPDYRYSSQFLWSVGSHTVCIVFCDKLHHLFPFLYIGLIHLFKVFHQSFTDHSQIGREIDPMWTLSRFGIFWTFSI